MKRIRAITGLGVLLALLTLLAEPFAQIANAAALTALSDAMSNQTASAVSSHTVKFTTPTGVTASQTMTITFPSGFTGVTGASSTNVSISGTSQNLTAATCDSTHWGVSSASQTVTLSSCSGGPTVAASGAVTITISTVAAITNPGTAANYSISIGGTMADSGSITVPILTNSQVAVSGTVNQSLSFSLGATSAALGTLSTGAAATSSHTILFATNGTAGMVVTISGATLTSGANTIAACATGCASSAGTAQFGINLVANTTPSVGAACSGSAPIGAAATNYNTVNTFRYVSGETVANSTGAINSTTCTVSYLANIAGSTPAGSYTTALTYTASATF